MIEKKKILGILGASLVLAAGFLYSCDRQKAEEIQLPAELTIAETAAEREPAVRTMAAPVFVHVCGAVQSPGVYELPEGSRYQDAVDAAGGFTGDADPYYLNLASLLSDGEQLVIPTVDEAKTRREAEVQSEEEDGRVDLNRAGKEELMTLPGIGEVRAEAILSYRAAHGAFSAVDELMEVSGIKESTFEKLKEKVKVGKSDG